MDLCAMDIDDDVTDKMNFQGSHESVGGTGDICIVVYVCEVLANSV